jgi:hypothetical protein
MNLIKLIPGLAIIFCTSTANGQFLNELKKRAQERAEIVVIDKTADKAGDVTAKSMDKILNPNLDGLMKGKGKKVDRMDLPDGYEFSYKYRLKMTTQEGIIHFDYYLNPGASYMGVKIDMGTDMFIVMDQGRNVNINYFNMGETSMASATSTLEISEEDLNGNEDLNDYVLTDLPNKEFLGYDCIGKQMENEEWKFIMYMAPDMEVSFQDVFTQDHNKLPPAMQSYADQLGNSLMMYMSMEDKKNKKKKNLSGIMECVEIEQMYFSIDNGSYQFM